LFSGLLSTDIFLPKPANLAKIDAVNVGIVGMKGIVNKYQLLLMDAHDKIVL